MQHNKLNKIKENKTRFAFWKAIICLILAFFLFFMESIVTVNANDEDYITVECTEDTEQVVDESSLYKIKQDELIHKQKELLCIPDHKEYFLEYKKLIEEYSEWFDPPKTIYDVYSEKDIQLLHQVVEAEATAGGFDEKVNVASVIFNRINHEQFGSSLTEVLTAHQFSPLQDGRAYTVTITEDTILACEYAFQMPDITDGAIYFESKDCNVHAAYAEFLFQDDIGHKFYK